MPSRMVDREHRNAASVVAAGLQHQLTLTEKLTERLTVDGALAALESGESAPPLVPPPSAEGIATDETDPQGPIVSALTQQEEGALEVKPPVHIVDLQQLQQLAMWNISFYTKKLLEVDNRLRKEVQQVWVARAARDEAARTAYEQLVAVRQYVTGVLDERAVQSMLDIEGATPSTPFELRNTLQRALNRLQAPDTFVPEPRIDGLEPEWERVVTQLQAVYEPLDQAVQKMEQEEKAARASSRERAEMRRIHRDALIGWRSMLQGMAIAAGDRELASDFRLPRFPSPASDGDGPLDGSPPTVPFPETDPPGFRIPFSEPDDAEGGLGFVDTGEDDEGESGEEVPS